MVEQTMNMRLHSLVLIFFLAQLPFGPSPPEKPKGPESPVKGWCMVSYFAVPPTQYSRAGKGIIKAESRGSRSSLFKKVEEKERDLPILAWRWKISNAVRSAIETRRDRFDGAARVMDVFGRNGRSKIMEGGAPSGWKIEYIWASRLPTGHIFDHPAEKFCK